MTQSRKANRMKEEKLHFSSSPNNNSSSVHFSNWNFILVVSPEKHRRHQAFDGFTIDWMTINICSELNDFFSLFSFRFVQIYKLNFFLSRRESKIRYCRFIFSPSRSVVQLQKLLLLLSIDNMRCKAENRIV